MRESEGESIPQSVSWRVNCNWDEPSELSLNWTGDRDTSNGPYKEPFDSAPLQGKVASCYAELFHSDQIIRKRSWAVSCHLSMVMAAGDMITCLQVYWRIWDSHCRVLQHGSSSIMVLLYFSLKGSGAKHM